MAISINITTPTSNKNCLRVFGENYLIKGIEGVTFLEGIGKVDEYFKISYYVPYIDKLNIEDPNIYKAMEFFKNSFKEFTDKYKKEYEFYYPEIWKEKSNDELVLCVCIKLKKMNDGP